MRTPLLVALLATACPPAVKETGDPPGECTWFADSDGDSYGDAATFATGTCDVPPDGYVADDGDCDDGDAATYPGAEEVCDGADQDCDGTVDEEVVNSLTWYLDADRDHFGDTAQSTTACTAPDGYTDQPGDCDDTDPTTWPGASERCDGADNDCDGQVDEDLVLTWYADADADGWGDPAVPTAGCDPGLGWVADATDCDDADPTTWPGAEEVCDGADNDCDGAADEGLLATRYPDADGDGFGDAASPVEACEATPGLVTNATDCDDANSAIHPDAVEVCDHLDNDCDGWTDDEDDAVEGAAAWYTDADADGWGDDASVTWACEAPAGAAAEAGDCDDADPAFHPGADESDCADPTDYNCDGATGYTDGDGDGYAACEECDDTNAAAWPGAVEICDGLDDDCDGAVDEDDAADAPTWYTDADADGYGNPGAPVTACSRPDGTGADATDCDDGDPLVHPGGVETCDGTDENCDGAADEGLSATWYLDADLDGFGSATTSLASCAPGAGWVADATDCDDGVPTTFPGAPETCDGLDDDCDGAVDEGVSITWYVDADGDGFGDPATGLEACTPPTGRVPDATDCDDTNAAIRPGAAEVCDTLDDDCDALVDDADPDVTGQAPWYPDGDGDGWGADMGATLACFAPTGTSALGGDCDDDDPAFNPGASEGDCTDPHDYNCDGTVGWSDADGDGFAACEECDDANAAAWPGATERCNGLDDDCDGTVDEPDAVDAAPFWRDADGDGAGDAMVSTTACAAPSGFVADASDCDDTAASVRPGAGEVCDGIDQDCDGSIDEGVLSTFYRDADGDGWGVPGATLEACTAPAGWSADATDCDDTTTAARPDASEVCDTLDNDCDGTIDESSAVDAPTWYRDADKDGYGSASRPTVSCTAPSGYVSSGEDCNDGRNDVNPAAAEECDGTDNDCDGIADEPDAVDVPTWYPDLDGDGYGDTSAPVADCTVPTDHVADGTDCDDANSSIHPSAAEACDGLDNDCDGSADEADAIDISTWYTDADADGYGDPTTATPACTRPSGTVSDRTDCDDTNAATHPRAAEVCDDADNDCDGSVDEGATAAPTWYKDRDGDGWGDPSYTRTACDAPSGYVSDASDCDDADAANHPGAAEYCDDFDNDCDGDVDEIAEVLDPTVFYPDTDGDGFGTDRTATEACDAPSGWVADATDCDDADADVYPGAPEPCASDDMDCDGIVPDICPTCLDLLESGFTTDGLYHVDPDGSSGSLAPMEVWCDMTTSGGGWTLIQRTVWDWTDSSKLFTPYATWYGSTLGSPSPGKAYRMAGQVWPYMNQTPEHMLVHEARDATTGGDCAPLYYTGVGGTLTVTSTDATLTAITSTATFVNGTTLYATDSSNPCPVSPYYAVPWFYSYCCTTCPTFAGAYYSTPHPMASYIDTTADLYGDTAATACASGAAISSYGYEGINSMEYYMR